MKNKIQVHIDHFNISEIFECGQCFRWAKMPDGSYIGVVGDRVINVREEAGKSQAEADTRGGSRNKLVEFRATRGRKRVQDVQGAIGAQETQDDLKDFEEMVRRYFDLDTDYAAICDELCRKDEHLKRAIEFADGIRLLNQPFEEMIFSFIISANNNVPRIMGIINRISRCLGEYIATIDGEDYYSFPILEKMAAAGEETFKELGCGYRASYLDKTAKYLLEWQEEKGISFEKSLENLPSAEIREELLKLCGVGPKVADCIMLFSGVEKESFPIDVWVARVMKSLYGISGSNQKVVTWAKEYFGRHVGCAQQYLFHYARCHSEEIL